VNIPHYSAMLYNGKAIEIVPGDDDYEPLTVEPPSEVDVDQGFMPGVTATETVELHRALSAWLGMHRRLHRDWHDDYRRRDPGGKRR
jgi:hypothetical protein